MKTAIISDIHANLEALQTALTFIKSQKVNRIICLGDIVGYGPRPNECADIVREVCKTCLLGNHDEAAVGGASIEHFNDYAREAMLWTREQLRDDTTAYLKDLPLLIDDSPGVAFVHSTPVAPQEWNYILNSFEAQMQLDNAENQLKLVFLGHSHIPIVFSYNHGPIMGRKMQLDLDNDRYIVNVGSVGQPRDGDPRASFVIWDETENTIEYHRLDYDIFGTYQEIMKAGLPRFLADRLLMGQ